jgi:diphosphomevalonate decarboxylase
LQIARVEGAPQRLEQCRTAILTRDFEAFAAVTELDSNMMHAVMMTSEPRLLYWQPATVETMKAVEKWRDEGIAACYTIDAGPNVHVICEQAYQEQVEARLRQIPGVMDVLVASPGGPARLLKQP